jgi:hypothetical protein
MAVDTTDLDPEIKAQIDGMSREELEDHLREEDPTSELRQGLAGEYFEERFRGATGGMSTDEFNAQMSLEREQEDDGGDEGVVRDVRDVKGKDEEEKEEPGKPHFEDKKK